MMTRNQQKVSFRKKALIALALATVAGLAACTTPSGESARRLPATPNLATCASGARAPDTRSKLRSILEREIERDAAPKDWAAQKERAAAVVARMPETWLSAYYWTYCVQDQGGDCHAPDVAPPGYEANALPSPTCRVQNSDVPNPFWKQLGLDPS